MSDIIVSQRTKYSKFLKLDIFLNSESKFYSLVWSLIPLLKIKIWSCLNLYWKYYSHISWPCMCGPYSLRCTGFVCFYQLIPKHRLLDLCIQNTSSSFQVFKGTRLFSPLGLCTCYSLCVEYSISSIFHLGNPYSLFTSLDHFPNCHALKIWSFCGVMHS